MFNLICMPRIEFWFYVMIAFVVGFGITAVVVWRLDAGIDRRIRNGE